MKKVFLIFCLVLHSCFAEIPWGPEPEWVKPIPFETSGFSSKNEAMAEGLLYDYQIDIDRNAEYIRKFKWIKNASGVQQHSNIILDFDPLGESLMMHSLKVHRGGTVIDKSESALFKLVQQENNLSQFLYEGIQSWIVFIDDMRPGDLLEYSFSRQGHKALKKPFSTTYYLHFDIPIKAAHFRILSNKSHELQFRGHRTDVTPTKKEWDKDRWEWSWNLQEVSALPLENGLPFWYEDPHLQISEYKSWKEVAEWNKKLFETQPESIQDALLLAQEFKQKHADPMAQALDAIRYVQDHIRYLGLEMGENSYLPTQPDIVLKRRYGDCKDKTLLLVTLLNSIFEGNEYKAYPALVHTEWKEHVEKALPSSKMFNHAIVYVKGPQSDFWIDPTLSEQGGRLHNLTVSPFGKALVVDSTSESLVSIDPLASHGRIEIDAKYTLDKEKDPVALSLNFTFLAKEADYVRDWLSRKGLKDFEEYFVRLYSKRYPGFELISPTGLNDDRDVNILTVNMEANLPNPWTVEEGKERKTIKLFSPYIEEILNFNVDTSRKSPMYLDFPINVMETHRLNNPQGWENEEEHDHWETEEMAYRYDFDAKDNYVYIRNELRTFKDHIPVEKLADNRSLIEKADERAVQYIHVYTGDADGLNWYEYVGLGFILLGVLFIAASSRLLHWFDMKGFRAEESLTDADKSYLMEPSMSSYALGGFILRKHWDLLFTWIFIAVSLVATRFINLPEDAKLALTVMIGFLYYLVYSYASMQGRRVSWNRGGWDSMEAFKASESRWSAWWNETKWFTVLFDWTFLVLIDAISWPIGLLLTLLSFVLMSNYIRIIPVKIEYGRK